MGVSWILGFLPAALLAQGQPVQFEVASIRPVPPIGVNSQQASLGLRMDGQQARIVSYSMRDYIAMAYRMKAFQIAGPDWLPTERYDIIATLPAGIKADQVPEMLQALLAERFQLKFHREQRELPVYALSRSKGPLHLTEIPADASALAAGADGRSVTVSSSQGGMSVNLGNGSGYTFVNNKFEAKKLNMVALANQLERFMDRPIVDQTGLMGLYDIALDVTAEDYQTMLIRVAQRSGVILPPQVLQRLDGASVPSLFDSFEKLGLKLEAKKLPQDVIVIDSALKMPTEN